MVNWYNNTDNAKRKSPVGRSYIEFAHPIGPDWDNEWKEDWGAVELWIFKNNKMSSRKLFDADDSHFYFLDEIQKKKKDIDVDINTRYAYDLCGRYSPVHNVSSLAIITKNEDIVINGLMQLKEKYGQGLRVFWPESKIQIQGSFDKVYPVDFLIKHFYKEKNLIASRAGWYKQSQSAYEEFLNSPYATYSNFGHPDEYDDLDPIYLWWYDHGNIMIEKIKDQNHVHDDSYGMVFWGRYIEKDNAVSLAWDPFKANEKTYLDTLLALEEKFGKNLKVFISAFGKGNVSVIPISQAIKQISNFNETNSEFFNKYKRYASKNITKQANVSGEWWIQDGQAHAADGNIGDMDHIAYVINYAQNTVADMDIQSEEDWNAWKYNAVQKIITPKIKQIQQEMNSSTGQKRKILDNQLDELKDQLRNPEYHAYDLIFENASQLGIDPGLFNIAEGVGGTDARLYGMKEFGWKRVEGRHVETWQLTKNDLDSIVSGLWDAYGENAEEATYNIEVRNPLKYYVNVPYQVLDHGNPAKLRQYDSMANVNKSYKSKYSSINKKAQVSLSQIYSEDGFDEEEPVYHYIYNNDISLDAPFQVKIASPQELASFMTPMGDITVFEAYRNFATKEQKQIVKEKIRLFDNDRIIILDGNRVLDGNHQLIAAIMSGNSQKYIDLSDYEEPEDELV